MKRILIISICIIMILIVALAIYNYASDQNAPCAQTQLTRKELAEELRSLSHKIEDQYPQVAIILLTTAGATIMETESILSDFMIEYSKWVIENLEDKKQI